VAIPTQYERVPLADPPLLEAVVEVRAVCEVPYALIPGLVAKGLGLEEWDLEERADAIPGVMLSNVSYHRFREQAGPRLVQTGPGLFAMNFVGDYGDFNTFADFVRRAFSVFWNVARPQRFVRTGVRYINLVKREYIDGLDRPFRFTFSTDSEVFPEQAAVQLRTFWNFEELGQLNFLAADPHKAANGTRGTLLDYDFVRENPSLAAVDDLMPWVAQAHDVIYQVFRGSLSEELHERLRAGGAK
jgi:uncharacterized protein (TIGR04255 family)